MFSDTKFWRLVWKEYRTQQALWLALLIATPLLQVGMLILRFVTDDFGFRPFSSETANGLMAIGFIASIVYLLGCCATMFSVEHETGVFDFQRVLPTSQPRVFWAKVSFAAASSLLLTTILWLVTRGIFLWNAPQGSTWFGTYGLLYMAEIFAWSIFASLFVRQPLWGVIAAIALQSLSMELALPYLTRGRLNDEIQLLSDDLRFTLSRFLVLALLVTVDVVLGKLWYEDRLRLPRWRIGLTRDAVASYPADAELRPYIGQRQIGWSRLLWLGWRDARWIVAGLFLWFAYCWRLSPNGSERLALMLTYFIGSFVCGLFAFASEQWGDRYRFCTERGCSPRVVWLSRHVIWLSPVLLMSVGVFWLCSRNPDVFSSNPSQAQFEWAAVVWGPLVCYAAGQLAAMLLRSPPVAIATGLGLTFLAIMWSILMTSWLAPTWWSVGSLPAIALFVTWLKAYDWVEERHDGTARWRLALGIGVPVLLLLAVSATYRVVQIPVVTLPAEWNESDTPIPLTAAEAETLGIYRRALAEMEAGNKRVASHEARFERTRQEHPDWSDDQRYRAAYDGFHKDWLAEQAGVVPLLREAHARTAVPLALLQPDLASFSDEIWMPDKAVEFSWLMVRHARQLLEAGQLDEAWEEIEVTWELLRRYWLRAAPVHMLRQMERYESMLWEVIADWGRHPDQSSDRIVRAIRRLEQLAGGVEAARHIVHRTLMTANLSLFSDQPRRQDIHKMLFRSRGDIESTWLWNAWCSQPWEQWRTRRVLRWRASVAVAQVQAAKQQFDANQPFILGNWSNIGTWDPVGQVLCETTVIPPNITWGMQVEAERNVLNQAEIFRATMLQLALFDWHREHGRYPRWLGELVPTYFAEVPRDPSTAWEFNYFPDGVGMDVTRGTEQRSDLQVIVPKGIPFLVTTNGNSSPRRRLGHEENWEFTDQNGKALKLEEALAKARIWLIEPPRPRNE